MNAQPLTDDLRFITSEVAEIIDKHEGISTIPNKWEGYDIFSIIAPDRHYVRIVMDDTDVVLYAFTRYGQTAMTRMRGHMNAELLTEIALAYLDTVEAIA